MSTFHIAVPPDFSFEGTIRSYGFFLLPPNKYNKETKTFSRTLRVNDKVVDVTISKSENSSTSNVGGPLKVVCNVNVSSQEQASLEQQIKRMLRIDATFVDHFYTVFPPAKRIGFGRLFRSPTLFEDIIKTMTNVNVQFGRTIDMNNSLCTKIGLNGAFPTALELSQVTESDLTKKCNVGYRAGRIITFAQNVVMGVIDLDEIEKLAIKFQQSKMNKKKQNEADNIFDQLKQKLLSINGFGEFSANNVLQLLGIFNIIPSDSETARHLRDHHKTNIKNPKEIHLHAQKVYIQYEPYQFLVYWYKLYEFETKFEAGFDAEIGRPPSKNNITAKSDDVAAKKTKKGTQEKEEGKAEEEEEKIEEGRRTRGARRQAEEGEKEVEERLAKRKKKDNEESTKKKTPKRAKRTKAEN